MHARRMLFLAEGNAETWDSLSGASRSALHAIRRAGWDARSSDVNVYGTRDWLVRLLSVRASRRHWAQHYHTGPIGFAWRSHRARAAARSHPAGAPILQVGATFLADTGQHPLFTYCDANSAMASRGGQWAAVARLSSGELDAVLAREREVYHACAGVFTFTEGLRRSMIDDFGVPPERVVTTYAGPNLAFFPADTDLDAPKADAPTILFIGRKWERKGGPTVVEAFARVRQAVPQARLLLAGCNPPLTAMPGIEIVGFVRRDDPGPRGLKALFLASDVFCMPSHYEPFGAVFSEAMVHGVACVGPRRYMSEIIVDGETGWLVEAGQAEELAEVLIRALSDRERLRAMGRAGRGRAMHLFNWDRVADRLLTAIESALPPGA